MENLTLQNHQPTSLGEVSLNSSFFSGKISKAVRLALIGLMGGGGVASAKEPSTKDDKKAGSTQVWDGTDLVKSSKKELNASVDLDLEALSTDKSLRGQQCIDPSLGKSNLEFLLPPEPISSTSSAVQGSKGKRYNLGVDYSPFNNLKVPSTYGDNWFTPVRSSEPLFGQTCSEGDLSSWDRFNAQQSSSENWHLLPTSEQGSLFDRTSNRLSEEINKVERCSSVADLPLNNYFGLEHQWIRTFRSEAGMGPEGGNVPGEGDYHSEDGIPFYTQTEIVNHFGRGNLPGSSCVVVPNIDPFCVDRQLQPGRPTGTWTPWNQCHTLVDDILTDCEKDKNKKEKEEFENFDFNIEIDIDIDFPFDDD